MTEVQVLAKYVCRGRLEDLSDKALEQLKIRVLDTIGVAIGALTATPIATVRKTHGCTLGSTRLNACGDEEGDKRIVRTEEEADHSLLAVAFIDGEVQPEQ